MWANWLIDADERNYVENVVVKIGSLTLWLSDFQAAVHKLQGRCLQGEKGPE